MLLGDGHRRQEASFRRDRDSGLPGQVSAAAEMRVDIQQDRPPRRREDVGTDELDSPVLHAGIASLGTYTEPMIAISCMASQVAGSTGTGNGGQCWPHLVMLGYPATGSCMRFECH